MNKENILKRFSDYGMLELLLSRALANSEGVNANVAHSFLVGCGDLQNWIHDYLIPEIVDEIFNSPEVITNKTFLQDTPSIKKKTKGGLTKK
jgi:hypothetical protein